MKRLFALIITLLFIVLPPAEVAGVAQHSADSEVVAEIDPNAELLGVVYYLAFGRDDPFVIDRGSYLDDVEAWFGPYRDHPAVKILRDYLGGRTSIPDRDYQLMLIEYYLLLCSGPPEIEPLVPPNFPWFEDEFLPALRDFARKTGFMKFYSSHEDHYAEDLTIYTGALHMLPPDGFMEDYSGFSGVQYRFEHPFLVAVHGHSFNPVINGTQIWGAGGMLPLVRRTPQRTLWSYRTARDTMFGLPLNRDIINSTYLNELLYLGFIYHELGHDVTLPALYASYAAVQNLTYLQEAIEEDMPYLARYDMHFWSEDGMLYEGFADAWEDFALAHVDGNYTRLAMEMQKAWGEFWIERLFYGVQDCALSVKAGEVDDFSACVPRLLGSLQRFASPENVSTVYEMEVPVTPLRAFDRGAQAGKVIVVYGTRNPDPSGTDYDRETADIIAENLRKFYSSWPANVDVEVKADVSVTDEDLSGNLVLVGGPVANSIAADMQKDFPFGFVREDGKWVIWRNESWWYGWKPDYFIILADDSPYRRAFNSTIIRGHFGIAEDASLIMAVRNPNNPENYIVWIAGTDRNLTRLFTNPTYYLSSYEVYSKEYKKIEVGFYVQPLASS
ncbi:DUF4932 domain-containing protein [Thermococcus pacificus]|uniref:S-layer protein C-terminal domain-containing protein n=1 Tax=Thermococcus pacificus TaxID=71998 RepID=A0A218P8F2_9EURY|nr:DUF4932 domain-containing protein [Thermococcus pacificus]ASJ07059.1 hypothetical protein A3L08_06850 [Thermococcus pacificus]